MVTYTKKNVSFLAMIYDRSQELIYFCHSQAPELFRTNFDSATLCVKIISVIRVEFCWVSLNPSWWYVFWNNFFVKGIFFFIETKKWKWKCQTSHIHCDSSVLHGIFKYQLWCMRGCCFVRSSVRPSEIFIHCIPGLNIWNFMYYLYKKSFTQFSFKFWFYYDIQIKIHAISNSKFFFCVSSQVRF